MSGFVKLFQTMGMSSVWAEDYETRLVWITLLFSADKNGIIEASPIGIAHVARVPLDKCLLALDKFTSPDPYSKDPEHEGRRLERTSQGYRLLNYTKYRDKGRGEDRLEYFKERREKTKPTVSEDTNRTVSHTPHNFALKAPIAEAEAEEKKEKDIKPKLRFDLEAIYSSYPRKTGKAEGMDKLKKLIRTQTAYDRVLAGVQKFAASPQGTGDKAYIPHFSTWVNGKRWEDYETQEHTCIIGRETPASRAQRIAELEDLEEQKREENRHALANARLGQQRMLSDSPRGESEIMEPEGLWDLPDSEPIQGPSTKTKRTGSDKGMGR